MLEFNYVLCCFIGCFGIGVFLFFVFLKLLFFFNIMIFFLEFGLVILLLVISENNIIFGVNINFCYYD